MTFKDDLKSTFYVAPRIDVDDNGTEIFGDVVKYVANVQTALPASSGANLNQIGPTLTESINIVGRPDNLRSIKATDRVYIDNPVPDVTDPLAKDADYRVKHVKITPMVARIILVNNTMEPNDGENGNW